MHFQVRVQDIEALEVQLTTHVTEDGELQVSVFIRVMTRLRWDLL